MFCPPSRHRGERVRFSRARRRERVAAASDRGARHRIAFSALLIFQKLQQMPARLHALVQYAHNLNHIR